MPISPKHLADVCMLGLGHKECRYLNSELDSSGNVQYFCEKKSIERQNIDIEVDEHIKDSLANGIDPNKAELPLGNNCKGFLPFKDLLQGYDCD